MNILPQLRRGAAVLALLGVALSPTLASADTLQASKLTLNASDLGPGWSSQEQFSVTGDPRTDYLITFASGNGRKAEDEVGVAPSPELADQLIVQTRELLRSEGATISSVQDQGFGDGAAFKASFTLDGQSEVAYIFRVHGIFANVEYRADAGASDLQSQALQVARKQESRLWAAVGS
jgi:hypothetical protein